MRRVGIVKALSVLFCAGTVFTSCSKISGEAKKIVGDYYNPTLSSELPVYEFRKDGTCVVRNILPDVLTMEVKGTWDVRNDSLIILNDISTLTCDGDTSFTGHVAPRLEREVLEFDAYSLTLGKDGIAYKFEKK